MEYYAVWKSRMRQPLCTGVNEFPNHIVKWKNILTYIIKRRYFIWTYIYICFSLYTLKEYLKQAQEEDWMSEGPMLQPHAPCFSLPAFLLPRLKPSMLRHLCWLSCLPRASSDRLLLLCTLRPLPLLLGSPGDPHPALSYPYIKISGLLPTKSS